MRNLGSRVPGRRLPVTLQPKKRRGLRRAPAWPRDCVTESLVVRCYACVWQGKPVSCSTHILVLTAPRARDPHALEFGAATTLNVVPNNAHNPGRSPRLIARSKSSLTLRLGERDRLHSSKHGLANHKPRSIVCRPTPECGTIETRPAKTAVPPAVSCTSRRETMPSAQSISYPCSPRTGWREAAAGSGAAAPPRPGIGVIRRRRAGTQPPGAPRAEPAGVFVGYLLTGHRRGRLSPGHLHVP